MNVYEMEGFLRGKCMPRDILVNESTAAYLVRKLNESATLKADRDAQQKRADALAVENAALKVAVDGFNQELYGKGFEVLGWHLNGDTEPLDNWFGENDWNPETPATDAALAAIEARGVEKLADKLDAEIEQFMSGAFFYDEISSREAISKMVREYATELREAK